MTSGQAGLLDRQLDSYRAIAQRRTHAVDGAKVGGSADWMRFAAAAGASLASAATADATINHVMPPSPIRINVSSNAATFIDMDGDAEFDFRFGAGVSSGPIATYFFLGTAGGLYDAEIIGDHTFGGYYFAVRKFQSNEVIPAAQPSLAGSYLRTSVTAFGSLYQDNGNWGVSDTGFAGIVDGINTQPRAGWIKIRTESFGGRLGAVEVLEWAYETVPGVAIMAGQTSSVSVPGDYNGNGSVGPEDYAVWKAAFGQNVIPGSGADGNSSGTVEAADYTVWRDHFNPPGSGSIAAGVPEPATVTLGVLALGAAGVAALRRCRNT
jgi:hypothetical protein